ncbi:DUF6619 domain-containing protein [Mahella sp.]|uniref:DUF6619 domain-containing protein n=1 Tax=Mahella sp. TaxID=2798721 RepID=UPI0025BCD1C9|nr:DUF6619 domain-containing protein [Mahella sp.]MBZ4666594.1 hypothetical protein [Mahella sp.]
MVKYSIRLTSFLFALFVFLLIFQYATVEQQQFPFNTTDRFELNITTQNIAKEEIINNLNEITDDNNGVLVKVVTNSEEYEDKKDIIWFGSRAPVSNDIIVKDSEIYWLDSSLTGELISSTDMGTRPLYGTYAIQGTENFKNEIDKWCSENGISVSWYLPESFVKIIYSYLVHNGIGNAIMTAFLLFITTLITWFLTHAKARTIRLLGGISVKRIHIEDTFSILLKVAIGFIIALIVVLSYIGISNSINQIFLVLSKNLLGLIFLLILSSILIYLISVLVRPKTEHLSKREIPLKEFKLLGTITRVLSVILALLIVPSTLTSAYIVKELSKEYSLWENMQNNVRIGFSYTDPLVTEEMIPFVEQFCNQMIKENNLSLSFVIDSAIALNPEEYGGYDHIIIADKAWINSFNIGIEEKGKGGQLTKVSLGDLQEPLRDFLNAQIPIWTKAETVQPDGLGYYEFTGEKFLALPPNVASGGSTVQAKRPLIILVENPISTFKGESFIVAALSSGNIVFSDEDILRKALVNSPIQEYVVSIDTIADVALEQAQQFGKEAGYYVVASVLIFIAMIFAGIMEAQLWADSNKKRIFALHTFGKSYSNIIAPSFQKELVIIVVTILGGSVLSFALRRPEILVLICVAIVITLLYCISNFAAYHVYTRKAFFKVSRRNE